MIREFCRVYPAAYQLSYIVRAAQEGIFNEAATIKQTGRIFGAYFSTRRLVAFAPSNSRGVNDFIQTIRHEILGHFGLNTFKPSEKKALIAVISETRNQPTLCELWSDVAMCYSHFPESFKAEEIFCLACEAVELNSTVDKIETQRIFHQVILARLRPMEYDDLFAIAVAVAGGFKNRWS